MSNKETGKLGKKNNLVKKYFTRTSKLEIKKKLPGEKLNYLKKNTEKNYLHIHIYIYIYIYIAEFMKT